MLTQIQPATTKPTDSDMLAIRDTITRPSNNLKVKGLKSANTDKIDETSHDFEAQFISQMLGTMSSTVDREDEVGGGSDAEDVYNSMLNNEYGKIIARTGGIGVADQVKRVMIKQQEVE